MAPPNQGFRYRNSLSAAASDNTGVLVAPCGASRGGGIQLSGTWVGTVLFEQTLDNGTTWIAKTVYPAAGGAGVTTAAANGQWKFACGGETHVRARCSAFTSGAIVVDATFTAGVDAAVIGGGVAGSAAGPVQSVQTPPYISTFSITRTADTTPYTGNDVIGIDNAGSAGVAAFELTNIGPAAGGTVLFTGGRFAIDIAAVPAGLASFRLALFSVTPPSALLDNVAFLLASGDRTAFRGFLDLGAPVDVGSTLYCDIGPQNRPPVVVPAGGSLFAYLITQSSYTPSSGDVFRGVVHSVLVG